MFFVQQVTDLAKGTRQGYVPHSILKRPYVAPIIIIRNLSSPAIILLNTSPSTERVFALDLFVAYCPTNLKTPPHWDNL